jgi:DEAD/DEAH box helicase domain-containing protein
MNINGKSTGRVTIPRAPSRKRLSNIVAGFDVTDDQRDDFGAGGKNRSQATMYRRHAADETALLLARAVAHNVRCIVFAKTRNLCEWIYERTITTLRSDPATEHLASRVESYRGGYTVEARRSIEARLFQNELLGVVGTSALELGVDIGGIDVSLHCGYPTSHSSLLQQAGRAGRGASCFGRPSLAIMISFNSPVEQHIWRHPTSLLSRGRSIPPSLPINQSVLNGHILCAADEFPLTGGHAACALVKPEGICFEGNRLLTDFDLLGSKKVYLESVDVLVSNGSLVEEVVSTPAEPRKIVIMKTHPVSHHVMFIFCLYAPPGSHHW